MDNNQPKQGQPQLQLELNPQMTKTSYSNLAIISHSSSEFVVDFVRVLPGVQKGQVKSRVILTPEHAKRLLLALQDNISKYENTFGPIRLPENRSNTFVPPAGAFKGEA